MVCYQCGCRLSEHDFCTGCGADVALYKNILSASNRLYNEGLEKAGVRDLSGAVTVLRQSLKFNKNNIEARNLLGLVFFEMGEVVAALSEWVISKNIRAHKNIADDYIAMIQANQNRLDTINQTIKKYNQALAYCYQDSQDLAIIQLKKVLSYNPRYIRAHQLLALLYINAEEWDNARNELSKCTEIDTNNTITLRYLKEINRMMLPDEAVAAAGKKKSADETIRYQSGNETIIQPGKTKELKGASTLLNLGIGIVIGVAITWSLILPTRLRGIEAESELKVKSVSEEMDAKTATIDQLEQMVATLNTENVNLQAELNEYEGNAVSTQATDNLLLAAGIYLGEAEEAGKIERIATYMDAITETEIEEASAAFTSLYTSMLLTVGQPLGDMCYEAGYADYRAEDFVKAIPNLLKAFRYDPSNGDALYNLANAYYETGDNDKAKEAYAKVIELFPGTEKARRSDDVLLEIQLAGEG